MHILLLALACGRGLPGPPAQAPDVAANSSPVTSMNTASSAPLSAAAGPILLQPVTGAEDGLQPIAELPTPPFADPSGWSLGSLALSEDGARILSGGGEGRLRLLDAESGALLLSLSGHRSAITAVRSLPGARALSGDAEGALWLWDLSGERPKGAELMVQHASPILTLAVDDAGRHGVSADARGNVVLWDLTSGQPIRSLSGEESTGDGVIVSSGEGVSAAFSPGGERLVFSSGGNGYQVIDTESGEPVGAGGWTRESGLLRAASVAMPAADQVRVLHSLLMGDTLLDGEGPLVVSDWSVDGQERGRAELEWIGGGVLHLSADGGRLAVSEWPSGVTVWTLGDAPEAQRFEALEPSERLAFSADGAALAFGGGGQRLNVARLAEGRLAHEGGGRLPSFLHPVALSAQGVAAIEAERRLWIWPIDEAPASFGLSVDALAFTRGGERLAALGGSAWVLDLDSGALLFEQMGELGYVTGNDLDASEDGAVVVLGEYDGHLSVLDGETGALKRRIETEDGELFSLRVQPDGRAVASVGSAGALRVRALPSGDLILDHALDEGSEIMGWGGDHVAVTGDEQLSLIEVSSGAVEVIEAEGVRWCAAHLSRDGRWLAWAREDGPVVLLDRRSGARHAFSPEEGPPQALAFDPAGERLLATWGGGLARVYAVSDLQDLDAAGVTEKSSPTIAPQARGLRTGQETLPPHALARLPQLEDVLPAPGGEGVLGLTEGGELLLLSLPKGEVLARRDLEYDYAELSLVSPEAVLVQADGVELIGAGLRAEALPDALSGPLALSPDGERFAVAESGALALFDREGQPLSRRAGAYADYANVVAWSPDGRAVAVAGTDLIVRVWSAEDLSLIAAFRAMAEVRELAFLSNSALAWTADADHDDPGLAVGRWGAGGAERQILHAGWDLGQSLALHPSGRRLAVADDAGVRFYDTQSGAYVAHLPMPSRPGALAFSPDGSMLVTTSWGEGALVWGLQWLP